MNKINHRLQLGMKGDAVADLQDALRVVPERRVILADDRARVDLPRRLGEERTEQMFDQATRKLVGRFQEARRLEPSGDVDEVTAKEFNSLLQEWGLLSAPRGNDALVDHRLSAACRIVDARSKPLPGLRIEAYDGDPHGTPVRLGQPTKTDEAGEAVLQFRRSDYMWPDKRSLDLLFRIYRNETLLDYQLLKTAEDGQVIIHLIPLREPVVIRVEKHHVVTGTVVQDNGMQDKEER